MNAVVFQFSAFFSVLHFIVRFIADVVSIFAFIAIIKYLKTRD